MFFSWVLTFLLWGYLSPSTYVIWNWSHIEYSTKINEREEESSLYASSMNPSYPKLVNPVDGTLKKLWEYKEVLWNTNPEYIMVFTRIPCSRNSSKDLANEVGTILKEYSYYGYTPIIIFEPGEWANGAHLSKIKSWVCDPYIDLFFSELVSPMNISEKQLWLIVPYPEINTPAFDRTDFFPSDFAPLVNQFFSIAQKHYPNLRWSILLDSKSYATDDWEFWEYASFKPYLDGLDTKYISSFWLQWFPWMSEDGTSTFFSMRSILPQNLLQEAASLLKTKNVWLNTGTIWRAYADSLRVSPALRWKMLNSLTMYLRSLKLHWYTPMVHIFSENNLFVEGENTDWSYTQSKEDMAYLWEFIKRVQKSWIKVGFYDQ